MSQGWSSLFIVATVLACIGLRADAHQGRAAAAGLKDSNTIRESAAGERQFAGGGQWRSQGDPKGQARSWRIHAVEGEDGAVKAKLSVLGVPGFEDLTVEGQIIGEDAFGVLLDDSGKQKATFNAKLLGDGSGGSFILGTGESGTWEYDASTKAALSKAASDRAPEN